MKYEAYKNGNCLGTYCDKLYAVENLIDAIPAELWDSLTEAEWEEALYRWQYGEVVILGGQAYYIEEIPPEPQAGWSWSIDG